MKPSPSHEKILMVRAQPGAISAHLGPGMWHVIHTEAWLARGPESQKCFAALVRRICENFPCGVCKGHCSAYLREHPPEDRKGGGEPPDVFIWSVEFHNSVNARLQKPHFSLIDAIEIQRGLGRAAQARLLNLRTASKYGNVRAQRNSSISKAESGCGVEGAPCGK